MPNLDTLIHSLRFQYARHRHTGGAGGTVSLEDLSFNIEEYITAQTLSADNYLVLVNAEGGEIRITLPAAVSHTSRIYTIKNIGSTGKVIIDANATETIDGSETVELTLQYSYVTIVCDGDEWFIIGGMNVKIEDLIATQIANQERQIGILENIETHLELGSGEELEKEETE